MVRIGVAVNPKCQCSRAYPPFQGKAARKLGSPFGGQPLLQVLLPKLCREGLSDCQLMGWWHQQKQRPQLKNSSEKLKGSGHIQWNIFPGEAFWCGLGRRFPLCPRAFGWGVGSLWALVENLDFLQMPKQEPHPGAQSRNLTWIKKRFQIKPQFLTWEKMGEAWCGPPHDTALVRP